MGAADKRGGICDCKGWTENEYGGAAEGHY